jgi:hypothetical protein
MSLARRHHARIPPEFRGSVLTGGQATGNGGYWPSRRWPHDARGVHMSRLPPRSKKRAESAKPGEYRHNSTFKAASGCGPSRGPAERSDRTTPPKSRKPRPRGKWITCGACHFGTVAIYSGGDFEGPGECKHCNGGRIWRYPSGVLWPDGEDCAPLKDEWPCIDLFALLRASPEAKARAFLRVVDAAPEGTHVQHGEGANE